MPFQLLRRVHYLRRHHCSGNCERPEISPPFVRNARTQDNANSFESVISMASMTSIFSDLVVL